MIRRLVVAAALASAAAAAAPTPAGAQVAAAEYAARRAALARLLPADGVVLAPGGGEPAEDYLSFFQRSPFVYLTGFEEPDAYLVLVRRGSVVSSTLFVEPKDPAREVWTGRRTGEAGVQALTGIPGRPVSTVQRVVDSLVATGLPLYTVDVPAAEGAPPAQPVVRAALAARPALEVRDVTRLVAQLRGTKSPAEQALIRRAVEITVSAQREAMAAAEPGMNEFELQALIEYTFRRNGADRPSFATIVGSGPNATTLHYNADDRFMQAGEVAVLDVGASYAGYAADVTRTLPLSGTFTPEQRSIYQLVRDAQSAAERQAKLGAKAQLMSDSAEAVLAAGLARLGLIESPTASYDCGTAGSARECPQLQLYYMHGLGHGIGLDVHDPEQFYFTGVIAAGSAFTIEPGIYVRENLLQILPDTPRNRALVARIRPAVERYRNIGVRIEDDYLVTDRGVEWISRAPRELAEVEAAMRGTYSGPAPRDRARVEGYRGVGR